MRAPARTLGIYWSACYVKIGAKVVSHGRYVTFQMAEVAVSRQIQRDPGGDRPAAGAACASMTEAVVRCDGRRCRVQLGGRTVTSSNTTAATGRFGGSAEHP